jgi:hypothetical protein
MDKEKTGKVKREVNVQIKLFLWNSQVIHKRFRYSILSTGQEFLATDPEVRIRFPELTDLLRNSGSGTGSTQPLEYNLGAT